MIRATLGLVTWFALLLILKWINPELPDWFGLGVCALALVDNGIDLLEARQR